MRAVVCSAPWSLALLLLLLLLPSMGQSGLTAYNQWMSVPISVEIPPPRAFHTTTLVGVPCGPVLLVFGGANQEASGTFAYLNDTWVFDLSQSQWYLNRLHSAPAPGVRAGHSAVLFDNYTVILFGGQDYVSPLSDVWIFSIDPNPTCNTFTTLGSWSQAAVVCAQDHCPEARWGHAAVMLESKMFMFGGSSEAWFNAFTTTLTLCNTSLWRLTRTNGAIEWLLLPTPHSAVPPPRIGAHATVISANSFLLASGFGNLPEALDDAWMLTVAEDGASARWLQLTALPQYTPSQGTPFVAFGTSVSLATGTASTIGGVRFPLAVLDNGVSYPQANASVFLWIVNATNASVTIVLKPLSFFGILPRAVIGSTVVVYQLTFFLFGGLNAFASYCVSDIWTQPITDVSCIDVSISPWVQLQLAYPPSVAFLGFTNSAKEFFTFGGQGNYYPTTSEMWDFGLESQHWHKAKIDATRIPGVRWGHSLNMINESVILFGGAYPFPDGSTSLYSDVWRWSYLNAPASGNGVNGNWTLLISSNLSSSPTPRAYHAAGSFNGLLYVHGGCVRGIVFFLNDCSGGILDDFWSLNLHTLRWTLLGTGPRLYGHVGMFNNQWFYLFHGANAEGTLNSIFAHDVVANSSKFMSVNGENSPPPRACAMMMPFGENHASILFGGAPNGTIVYNDTWVYLFDLNEWVNVPTTGFIPQLYGAAMAVARDTLYVFGGMSDAASEAFNGMYTMQLGCNAGFFSPNILTTHCQPCPLGTYASSPGMTSCSIQCPSQLSTPAVGATSVQNCTVCGELLCHGHGTCSVQFDSSGPSRYLCSCTGWYRWSENDDCNTPVVSIILVCILGAVLLTGLGVLGYTRYKRVKRAHSQDRELHKRLLDDTRQELMALERVWDISPSHLTLVERLARGTFGEVHRATYEDRDVAVKVLRDMWVASDLLEMGNFNQEMRMLRTLRHRNIVFFYGGGVFDSGVPFIVVEFMSRGSLEHILHDPKISNDELTVPMRIQFLIDCAEGMRYLHERTPPLVHRDLKSANLLVSESWVVKVGDFGTAQLLRLPQAHTGAPGVQQRTFSMFESKDVIGTLLWMAPEILQHLPYDSTVDVYSFGIVLWEVVTRRVPYEDIENVATHVVNGGRPPLFFSCSKPFARLIQECWSPYPAARPSFADCSRVLERMVRAPAPPWSF
eukprot:m.127314 g.127314  ORF g.127314 m.127314 type:complete len:1181 (-) comp14703_c0_seq1:152-3694(-)